MSFHEYTKYDAVGLADLIKRKEVSADEVLDAAITQYEKANPDINAVTHTMFDEARDFLKVADSSSPLYGVPFLLKDLGTSYMGVPTTNGSRFFDDFVPQIDSEIVRRQKKAGLVIMGKTNTPEFGTNWITESVLLGACRNPYDLSKTPGGSSGGAAAAVAASIVPVAHASDGGGSIRVPASCCGLVGLKPTRARVPYGPERGESCSGLAVQHALTRTVRDSALLLDMVKGPEVGDPYAAPSAPDSYLAELEGALPSLKIGVVTQAPGDYPIDPDCLAAVSNAVKQCEDLGCKVEEATLPDLAFLEHATTTLWAANISAMVQRYADITGKQWGPDNIEAANLYFVKLGAKLSAAEYARSLTLMHYAGRQVAAVFEEYDLILTPTLAKPAVDIGELFYEDSHGSINDFYKERGFAFSPFTSLYNVTGQPAISLPLHKTASGFPVGVQFAARFGDELTLLRLANHLMDA